MRDYTPRIAFFTDSFHETNGVARTSRELAAYARAAHFPFLSVHPGPQTAHLRRGSYETFEVASSRTVLHLEHDMCFDLLFLRHLRSLRKAVAAFDPDAIHVTGPGHCGILGALLAHESGVPMVASWHTNVHEYGARRMANSLNRLPALWNNALSARAERWSLELAIRFYRLARMAFAPNPELVELLRQRAGCPVHLMERGIDCQLFTPSRRLGAEDVFTIGYVGRLSAEKNVRLFAALDQSLRQQGLTRYRFLIVGEGSERAWLRQHLPSAELPGLLHGDALANAYAKMDAFVFPSETDTYGNVVQEAMASGVPCVVSAHGGPQYVIEPGQTGFVARDLKAYTSAVLHLASDAGLQSRMSLAAREAALLRGWSAVFDRLYAAYRAGFQSGLLRPSTGRNQRPVMPRRPRTA